MGLDGIALQFWLGTLGTSRQTKTKYSISRIERFHSTRLCANLPSFASRHVLKALTQAVLDPGSCVILPLYPTPFFP